MAVYFIGNDDFVKIGQSQDPERRLKDLQTGSPVILRLLAVDEHGVEEIYHRHCESYHMHGEWFRNSGKVARLIRELNSYASENMPEVEIDSTTEKLEFLKSQVKDLAATNRILQEKYDAECLAHSKTRLVLDEARIRLGLIQTQVKLWVENGRP